MKRPDLFPYCHVHLSFRRRAALWLMDKMEAAWEWAHSPNGDGALGLALVLAGMVLGVCLASLLDV